MKQTEKARSDSVAALHCYGLKLKLSMFEKLLRIHKSSVVPSTLVNLPFEVETMATEKLKIPITCSRLLIGVAFPELLPNNFLAEGECIVLSEIGPVLGDVVVYRSPSYSPGDIQVLKGINPEKMSSVSKLKNVIIFSTNGLRPDPDKLSGGDLDGDLYLVIWDKRVLEFSNSIRNIPAASYNVPEQSLKYSSRTAEYNRTSWVRYVAQWENSLLAQIDSTYFKLASMKGINSQDCRELSALFSRAVDQTPSDLDQLRTKMAISTRTVDQGPFVQDIEELPIWERMLIKQSLLLSNLKTRNTYLDVADWNTFFETLVDKNEPQIEQILNDINITQSATDKQIEKIKHSWFLLSSKHFKPTLPRVLSSQGIENETPMCVFDCVEKNCPKDHPHTLDWYNCWTETVKLELDVFIEPIRDEIAKLNEIVIEQERRLKSTLTLYAEQYEQIKQQKLVLMEKYEIVQKHINKIRATFQKSREIGQLNLKLEEIKKKREPGFFEYWLGVLMNMLNFLLRRDRQLTAEEKQLLKEYQRVETDIGKAKDSLSTLLTAEQFSYQEMENEIGPLFQTPKLEFGVSASEIQAREKSCDVMKQNIIDKSKSCKYPSVDDVVYKAEMALKSNMVKLKNQQSRLTADKMRIKAVLDLFDSSVPSDESQPVHVLHLKTLNDKLLDIEEKLEAAGKSSIQLQHNLDDAYSYKTHQETLEKIEKESEKVNPFNLALCAVLNEVNSRFDFYRADQSDRRSISNQELKMCLRRERNRCRQECSNNKLPIFSKRFQIMSVLKEHNALIVVAETGSGKSTQVPQYLADDLHQVLKQLSLKMFPKIVCTQPRRVAATSIADRVSLEYSGSIDSTKSPETEKQQDTKVNLLKSKKAAVVAYPLYASSGSKKRALDVHDRLGWHEELPPEHSKAKSYGINSLHKKLVEELAGTPGEVGGWVGFQIGSRGQSFEERKDSKKISVGTRIEFVTEGLLLQKLKSQKDSIAYDCVIVDEAHERGKDTDFLMALLRKIVIDAKCNLKVVVMSASINKRQFSDYFGKCPVIECKGKKFKVEKIYRPLNGKSFVPTSSEDSLSRDIEKTNNCDKSRTEEFCDIERAVKTPNCSSLCINENKDDQNEMLTGKNNRVNYAVNILFTEVHPGEKGDVLIFLPGKNEIHDAVDQIQQRAEKEFAETDLATQPEYVRKVVCCTNIAETSLTIPGVKFVIDVGQAKKITYDHELRISALVLTNNSQASAKQRKGRAGRIEPGFCYRICSKMEFDKLAKYDTPELNQCSIDEVYLYALSVFGSIEQLELMPDAQPSESSLEFAKERLLNLEFVEKQPNEKIELTADGKLAASLLSDLSIEDTRMILAAKEAGMATHALQLAVLMKNSKDLQVREPTDQMTEKFNVYLDQLGDAFTWLKIYTTYLEIKSNKKSSQMIQSSRQWRYVKTRGVKKWSEELGVNVSTLRFVDKSVDLVYKTLKRQGMLGKDFKDLDLPLDEIRAPLCKALVAGYFHNTAELHDVNFMKAGYSMLTSANVQRPMCVEKDIWNVFNDRSNRKHTHLLKLDLSNRSTLTKHGDVVKNTYLVFTSLFKIASTGRVFMQQACRVTPEMIVTYSNKNWQKQCQVKSTASGNIESVVVRRSEEFIGPKILAGILKTNPKNYLKELEKQSGAKTYFMFEHGQIRVYGSECEVTNVLQKSSLLSQVVTKRLQCLTGDYKVPYPLWNKQWTSGCFESGLRLNFEDVSFTEVKTVQDWKSIKTSVAIFVNIDHHRTDALLSNIAEMKLKCLDEKVKREWGAPRIPDNCKWTNRLVSYCKMLFQSENVAKYVCERFDLQKQLEFTDTQCFLDSNEEIPVADTKIYPSVFELGKKIL